MAKACVNPNCKSRGQVHPNCRCHGGYASGGMVQDFCSTGSPHQQGCMYAQGGAVNPPLAEGVGENFRLAAQSLFGDDTKRAHDYRNEPGLQTPLVDPVDLLGGALAAKAGKALAKDAGTILGNEIGAIGRNVKNKSKGLTVLSREEALEQGVRIPEAHVPSADLEKEVEFNYRLNNLPEVRYAVKDGKVVGHLGLDDKASVKAVYVDPDHRGQGVAKQLYKDTANKLGTFSSDELSAMEPEAKAVWESLKKEHPKNVFKERHGYVFQDLENAPGPEIAKGAASLKHEASDAKEFYKVLKNAQKSSTKIKDSVHLYKPEDYKGMKTFLSPDKKSGFAVKEDGDLVSVFSTEKGRGDDIVKHAKEVGASKLDAFDNGYLKEFYGKHGFKEYKREPNWSGSGPDVTYMKLEQEAPDLIHYSTSSTPLKEIDPAFMGTGSAGREAQRGDIIPRSYYYEAGAKPEDQVLQNARTVHKIKHPGKIIDLSSEEAMPFREAAQDMNDLERKLQAAGYEGYKNSGHPTLPNAVAVFGKKAPTSSKVIAPEDFEVLRSGKTNFAEGGNVGQPAMGDVPTWDSTMPLADAPTWESTTDYGSAGQQAITALEGFGQGVAGPLAPMAEEALGVDPQAILARRLANPISAGTAEIAGLVGPALLTGGASTAASTGVKGALKGLAKFTQAGLIEQAAAKVLPKAVPTTLAGAIGTTAAKAAIENGLISGSDEVSRMVLNDPHQTAQSAIANIGLGATLGGLLGGTLGGASYGIEKAGPKVSKFVENLKGRLGEHVEGKDPLTNVTKELTDYHSQIANLHDEVYGSNGLKSKDIGKALPEMNEKIAQQGIDTYTMINKELNKMVEKPNSYPPRLVERLRNDLAEFEQAVENPEVTSAILFNAKQDLKQKLQAYAKFDKQKTIIDPEYDFVISAKNMANKIRTSLEDSDVWGKAGERQAAINKAFYEYSPTLKDFQKKFMTEINGEKVIDQGKVATYLNQLEKPNAEIKKEILKNFIDKTEAYKKVIGDSHTNLGIESPIADSAMNSVLATFGKKTSGAKAADFIANKLAPGALGASAGASVGALLAGPTGSAVGALAGGTSLAPFFNFVLPSLIKFLGKAGPANPAGIKAAVDYTAHAVQADITLSKLAKAVFKVAPSQIKLPDTSKLEKQISKLNANPQSLLNKPPSPIAYYMPDHAAAMDEATANAISYLNTIRPSDDKAGPLDPPSPPSSTEKAAYKEALIIAQEPTIVFEKIKEGTITKEDITHLTSMYPGLYSSMSKKLVQQMVDADAKGELIPYKTRIGLSMFLAQPMDATFQPQAIMNAQTTSKGMREAKQQQDQAAQGGGSTGVKSSPGLQKMPSIYSTPGQTRQMRSQGPKQ